MAQQHSDPATRDAPEHRRPSAAGVEAEQPSAYCPRCSARLESRKCKMICSACGYYMSCSDFY